MIATCDRCGAWAMTTPDVADRRQTLGVDILPLDRDAYIASLLGGVTTYDVDNDQNGGYSVRTRRIESPAPTFDPAGAQTGAQKVHRLHACPGATYTKAGRAAPGKASAPATRGSASGGNPRATAPVAGSTPSRHATPATHRRSDLPVRCDICDRLIKPGEYYSGIWHNRWYWAAHTECE
jgi:hypothetical protein